MQHIHFLSTNRVQSAEHRPCIASLERQFVLNCESPNQFGLGAGSSMGQSFSAVSIYQALSNSVTSIFLHKTPLQVQLSVNVLNYCKTGNISCHHYDSFEDQNKCLAARGIIQQYY